jgi:1-deoxy-D-xylulose-5-phosphate synthase
VKFFNDNGYDVNVKCLGIEDRFIEHGTPAQLYALCGYDVDGIERNLKSVLE